MYAVLHRPQISRTIRPSRHVAHYLKGYKMHCVADGRTIRISANLVEALSGLASGYRVSLHQLPGYVFEVAAGNVDDAQRIAHAVAVKHGKAVSNAATIQRF